MQYVWVTACQPISHDEKVHTFLLHICPLHMVAILTSTQICRKGAQLHRLSREDRGTCLGLSITLVNYLSPVLKRFRLAGVFKQSSPRV